MQLKYTNVTAMRIVNFASHLATLEDVLIVINIHIQSAVFWTGLPPSNCKEMIQYSWGSNELQDIGKMI